MNELIASLPLDDLKVLELGQLIAGPTCGQVLADFGAQVVKIEPPGKGDAMRQWGQTDESGEPLWWNVIARNKQSLTLDLRKPEGQDLLRRLAAKADVLIENFRPGTMERWGLDYQSLSADNPGLIMVRVTGFGQDGPYASRAGFAAVCEAMGGLRYISGYPDRPPVRVGISLGDTLAGVQGAMGALLALHQREKTGRGQVVDSAIFEAVMAMMESLIPDYARAGKIRERAGSFLPKIAPSNAYPARDGRDVIIGANQDTVFRRLCEAMGQPTLADHPDYADHRARGENQQAIDELIAAWTAHHDAQHIVDLLADAGVPAGLVYTAKDMLEDEHIKERGSIVEVPDRHGKPLPMQNVFPRLSQTPGKVRQVGPALGEHTEAVLGDWLELDHNSIDALRKDSVI
ncbi:MULTISPECIES: CoA transferase [unclassified Halomonas]|uniref:CoA transferase n=1 Tax=Halomonas sp. H10-59 TaxID=2950874 RepID=A0AAU7KUF9_9GAMM|nr:MULTISPECIES: CoA transferase [unclassified Halomonas]MBS8271161.1 CoA transferase [Halomonas litopenaei]MAR74407.1 formyl-CoA transferase [Halomonas sp.]MBY5943356.1 CoA transferase [Halomonas sp. DP5N14-9]MBY6110237.1 CoA transferase [Halomonas sp. DP1Y21-3]RQW71994.1 CoA transferase [Halomonas sp. YLB-10]|tara:strand:- start:448 stop:1656 length:1209 start_codon:yes stop_codon:yes gene_type:complete